MRGHLTAEIAQDVTAWATLALVLVTLVYVVVTARLARHNRASARAAEAQLLAQSRPLLVDCQRDNCPGAPPPGVHLVQSELELSVRTGVRNVGGGPAGIGEITFAAADEMHWDGQSSRSIVPPGEAATIMTAIEHRDDRWTAARELLRAGGPLSVTVVYGDLSNAENFRCTLELSRGAQGWGLTRVSHEKL